MGAFYIVHCKTVEFACFHGNLSTVIEGIDGISCTFIKNKGLLLPLFISSINVVTNGILIQNDFGDGIVRIVNTNAEIRQIVICSVHFIGLAKCCIANAHTDGRTVGNIEFTRCKGFHQVFLGQGIRKQCIADRADNDRIMGVRTSSTEELPLSSQIHSIPELEVLKVVLAILGSYHRSFSIVNFYAGKILIYICCSLIIFNPIEVIVFAYKGVC